MEIVEERRGDADSAIGAAVAAVARGDFVVLLDDESAQGTSLARCCIAFAAEHASADRLALIIKYSTGIVSCCVDAERLRSVGFAAVEDAGSGKVMSVDFVPGMSTGASAKDRAATLKALCDTSNVQSCFASPGHTFLLRSCCGGVLEVAGTSEAICDLCRMARVIPVGGLAELMRSDGEAFTVEDARQFGQQHGLSVISVVELQAYRRHREAALGGDAPVAPAHARDGPLLDSESRMWIDDVEAECSIRVYSTSDPKIEIVTVVKGDVKGKEGVPARVHSECFTGDVIGSKRCDCGQQLHKFLRILDKEDRGVLMYVKGHEGRGIGLSNKIRAYQLQDGGADTVDANLRLGLPVDTRRYEDALAVCRDLGIRTLRLFTNNPDKVKAFRCMTSEVVAMVSTPSSHSLKYLNTKRERLNHRTILETFKLPTLTNDVSTITIGIVYTTWNQYFVNELLRIGSAELERAGCKYVQTAVPGACELVSGARAIIRQVKPDAVIVMGVLIRGFSDVYEPTCTAVMTGLTHLNASQDTPIIAGVLMCQDEQQAHERTHGPHNPAKAWAETSLHMASLSVQAGVPPPPELSSTLPKSEPRS